MHKVFGHKWLGKRLASKLCSETSPDLLGLSHAETVAETYAMPLFTPTKWRLESLRGRTCFSRRGAEADVLAPHVPHPDHIRPSMGTRMLTNENLRTLHLPAHLLRFGGD